MLMVAVNIYRQMLMVVFYTFTLPGHTDFVITHYNHSNDATGTTGLKHLIVAQG